MIRQLFLDIETSPNQAFTWGIWEQNIPIGQIINSSSVLCYSAKWAGERKMHFASVQHSSRKKMLKGVHALLEEADVVTTYNGRAFDLPVLNREFLVQRMPPPAPYKQVDLLLVARRRFRFVSNKMDYVAQALGEGKKVRHPGFQMWVDCMEGKPSAWRHMERYNKEDVRILERLYARMLPWVPNHPNVGAFDGRTACPSCGGEHLQRRGEQVTRDTKYFRYQCIDCGTWSRNKVATGKSKNTLQGVC